MYLQPEAPGTIDKITLTSIGKLMEEILEGTYQSHFTRKEFILNSEFQQGEPFEVLFYSNIIFASIWIGKLHNFNME